MTVTSLQNIKTVKYVALCGT